MMRLTIRMLLLFVASAASLCAASAAAGAAGKVVCGGSSSGSSYRNLCDEGHVCCAQPNGVQAACCPLGTVCNLAAGVWSGEGILIQGAAEGVPQDGVPAGCERRMFSVPATGEARFLRLQAVLAE